MRMSHIASAVVAVCVFSMCFADVATAQGGRGFNTGYLGLLRNESVWKEIELVDDQRDELNTLREELEQEMRDRFMEMRESGMSREELREQYSEIREEMQERTVEMQEQVEEVLLPAQIKRLKELEIQNTARRRGGGSMGALQSEDLLEELGIDEDQKKKLEEKAEAVKKKLQAKIKKLTEEAED